MAVESNPVLRSAYSVVQDMNDVSVNVGYIDTVAQDMAEDKFVLPAWDWPPFPQDHVSDAELIDYYLIGNSINFAFRDFATGQKPTVYYDGGTYDGAVGMWAALSKELWQRDHADWGPFLEHLTDREASRIFQTTNSVGFPMMERRVECLNQVGATLNDQLNGSFANLFKPPTVELFKEGRNGVIGRISDLFEPYRDFALYDAEVVHFAKKVQLALGMLYGRFQDRNVVSIKDPESFTVYADYNLPNVLRHYGLIEYSDPLRERIDMGVELLEGETAEIEIRAATIYVCDKIIENLNSLRDDEIYAPHLDAKLFEKRDQVATRPHLCKTTNY